MDNEEFEVTDMYLAAAMMSYGAELDRVDKSDKRRQKFIFIGNINKVLVYTDNGFYIVMETPQFTDVESKYYAKRLFFPPSYPDAVRSVKSAIHS